MGLRDEFKTSSQIFFQLFTGLCRNMGDAKKEKIFLVIGGKQKDYFRFQTRITPSSSESH